MNAAVTQYLTQLSDALATQVAAASSRVTAIRVGANRHISGIVWRADAVVTSDQALPALDLYSLTGAGGTLLPARAARRDPATNLACLTLDTQVATTPMHAAVSPAAGSLVFALGAAADGSPTVRLAAIHWVASPRTDGATPSSDIILLDLARDMVPEGGPVFDARGGLLGMASVGPNGEALVVSYATISRFLDPLGIARTLPAVQARRGWLGLALQPINVPQAMRAVAHQSSGRMVVSMTAGGPAELAGMRLGDVLLAIDGHSVSGPLSLRTFIGAERIGDTIEVRLLREGAIRAVSLTIAPQPGG
jgi:S1-C subfamily serine protease